MAYRVDTLGTLRKPVRLDSGMMRVDAHISRVGVYTYRNADGSTRRELRLPEDVMRADSLASFQLVPVTNDHPPGLVNADNARSFTVGSVGENVRADGDHVAASLMVMDAKTIADIEAGKVEVSCGYACDFDATPGTHSVWGRYDGIQRNIRGNHVAIVAQGRAGSARLRLDAGDAVMTDVDRQDTQETIMKVTINGVEVDLPDTVCQLIAAERKDAQTKLDTANTALERMTADRDAQKARADSADKARTDAADGFGTKVAARVRLLTIAGPILGHTVKLDALGDTDIQKQVLGKLVKGIDLTGKSDVYVEARFDAETARLAGNADTHRKDVDRALAEHGKQPPTPGAEAREDGEDPDVDATARVNMVKAGQDAWRGKKS